MIPRWIYFVAFYGVLGIAALVVIMIIFSGDSDFLFNWRGHQ